MIFNQKYNNLITLMSKSSEEFEILYNQIVAKLPLDIILECEKCQEFKIKKGNIAYELYFSSLINNTISLTIDDEKNSMYIELCLSLIDDEELDTLGIWDYNDWLNDNEEYLEFGNISIAKNDNEVEFSFQIRKYEENKYNITVEKNTSVDKPINLNELKKQLYKKDNKR